MNENKLSRRSFMAGLLGTGVLGSSIKAWPALSNQAEPTKIKEYRTLGRTGFQVSDIGCGPILIQDPALLAAVLESGVNFINAAEQYGRANERMIGQAIQGFDRKSFFITGMLILNENESYLKIIERANQCIENMKTDYVDCLMIHHATSATAVKSKEFHKAAAMLRTEGKVKSVGVSCHGSSMYTNLEDTMETILGAAIEDGRFDLILLVYNFVQKEEGKRILKACRHKNIGTTLMKTNPFGGFINHILTLGEQYRNKGEEVPEALKQVERKFADKRTAAESFIKKYNLRSESEIRDAAIKYVLSDSDVHSVLITFRNYDDIDNYLRLSGGRLTAPDQTRLAAFAVVFSDLYCRHACGRCEPYCPYGVPIQSLLNFAHSDLTLA